VTPSSTGTKHKPALDEASFQQLLSAAYVVQQHNESAQKEQTPGGRSQVLAVIAEIQSLIRTQSLNVADGCALIGERLLAQTDASGVSISLVDNGYLDCVAEAGIPAKVPGSSISSHSLSATEQLKSGHIFQSENCLTDSRLDTAICREIGVGSLIAAPVLRFGEIAGLVEVRWAKAHGFGELELRACRLMAVLVTGTLERSVRIGNARTAAAPTTDSEIERDQQILEEDVDPPQIAAPETYRESPQDAEPPLAVIDPPTAVAQVPEVSPAASEAPEVMELKSEAPSLKAASPVPAASCRMCGRPFAGDEQFCGFCSMPRPAERKVEELQSKWASLWFMQQAQRVLRDAPPPSVEAPGAKQEIEATVDDLAADSIPDLFPEPAFTPVEPAEPKPVMWPRRAQADAIHPQPAPAVTSGELETEFPFEESPNFFERTTSFAKRRWRELTLAVVAAALAYGLVLARPKPGQPTWFQSLMVQLGVQQKPAKVFAGTPDTRVWIDVHTQLYYCSGQDLYGKTPDGEFTTQYNAQSDGFLPASNTTCP
jgi:hypothetical protein